MKKCILLFTLCLTLVACGTYTKKETRAIQRKADYIHNSRPSHQDGLGVLIFINQSLEDFDEKHQRFFSTIHNAIGVGPTLTVSEPDKGIVEAFHINQYPTIFIFKEQGKPYKTTSIQHAINYIERESP